MCSSLNWFYGEICVCNLVLHAVQVNLRKRLNIWQKQFLSILHQQSCMPQEVHYHCFFFGKVSCWSYGSCMNEICLYNFLYVFNNVNLWCFTATVYIKMKKPNAAIRDANAALEVVVCPILFTLFTSVYNLIMFLYEGMLWGEVHPTYKFNGDFRLTQIQLRDTSLVAWHRQCSVSGKMLPRIFTWHRS